MKKTLLAAFLIPAFVVSFGGCPQPAAETDATFSPGTGDDFGTIDDAKGNTFQVFDRGDGSVRVTAQGVDGTVDFVIDSQGRLTSASSGDGNEINLVHNVDGSVNVSGFLLVDGRREAFDGVIPAGTLPANTTKPLLAAQSDPLIVCVVVQLFCNSLNDIIDWVIQENIGMFISNLPAEVRLFLPDPQNISFPTGIGAVDNGIRAEVRQAFPVIVQLEGFCTVWELLDLDDFCASA